MRAEKNGHSMDFTFVLLLVCIFAVCVLISLVLGTKIYTSTNRSIQQTDNQRTALSYITEKLRHCDQAHSVRVEKRQGQQVLVLSESYEGTEYETRIYAYEGWLKEIFAKKGLEFDLSAGSNIIEAQSAEFELSRGGLLSIVFTDPWGKSFGVPAAMRSGGELS